jgi:hypothetical protein
MKRTPKPTQSGEQEKLDLVERTMKKAAAESDADFGLLSRLDVLRTDIRQALRRRSKGRQA